MIIGIDNVSTGLATSPKTLGGMRNYLYHFITSLVKRGPQHKYVLFSPDWFESPFDNDMPNLQDVRVGNVPIHRVGRVFFEQISYRRVIHNHRPDVFVGLQNTLPLELGIPSAVFIKSIQYIFFPEAYNKVRYFYLYWAVRAAVHSARSAIVPTASVGNDLARALGVPMQKIEVLPEALYISDADVLKGTGGLELREKIGQLMRGKPFVLCVGATYGYKNLERLVRAFAQFRAAIEAEYTLLIVGGEAAMSFEQIMAVAEEVGLHDSVVCSGVLTDKEVIAAYNMAEMMVMPSLYETFGHPILEAMACGCPVVTSNTSAMPEVAGNAAQLVDPYDVNSIAEGMLRVASDCSFRTRLVDLGRHRAAEFSWEKTAYQALEILEKVRFSTPRP